MVQIMRMGRAKSEIVEYSTDSDNDECISDDD